MYPFNTENRSYKLSFRDRVKNLTDDSLFVDITKNLSTNAGPNTFNPYTNIPYEIPITRALYPELFPLNQHEHSIFLRLLDSSNNLIYQTLESVSPAYPVYDRLLPDIYTDWTTKKLRGQFGNVLDDLQIMRDKIYEATAFEYDLVDGDTVLVTNRGIHSLTTSGFLPQPLQGYDGDLSIVFHCLSLVNDSSESIILTSINPNVNQSSNFYSGWYIRVIDSSVMIRIERNDLNEIMINSSPIPTLPPHAGKLHILGFVYTAGKGSISRLKAFWDGVSIGYTNNSYKAINWDTSTGVYFNRFNDISPVGKSYNAGFKVFKKVLTNAEMLEQHTDRPVLVDKLIVTRQDDYVVNVSFENLTVDGFILIINQVYPYNTDTRHYKLGFRDEVYDIATNTRVAIGVEDLQTNAETANFDSYALPYDIPITRALYPGLFPIDTHEHRIGLRLQSNTNAILLEIKGLFISPNIPKVVPIPDIYIHWPTQSIRDKTGAYIDDIIILDNSSNSASSSSQY